MAIENFISVKETEGPKLATALEQHRSGAGRRRRPGAGAAGERRGAEVAFGDPVHRRALAADERAGRSPVPQQGRGLLPALRWPVVQGQARGGDRRRQLRRRGGHRSGRHRVACNPAGIRFQPARR
ncbi:hypothetical protein G6F32_015479 [Rhizopus arrhizus]|nr:hypothetical protein G6F32_015479 [Rhizopus arrhizus]